MSVSTEHYEDSTERHFKTRCNIMLPVILINYIKPITSISYRFRELVVSIVTLTYLPYILDVQLNLCTSSGIPG